MKLKDTVFVALITAAGVNVAWGWVKEAMVIEHAEHCEAAGGYLVRGAERYTQLFCMDRRATVGVPEWRKD